MSYEELKEILKGIDRLDVTLEDGRSCSMAIFPTLADGGYICWLFPHQTQSKWGL